MAFYVKRGRGEWNKFWTLGFDVSVVIGNLECSRRDSEDDQMHQGLMIAYVHYFTYVQVSGCLVTTRLVIKINGESSWVEPRT